MCGRFTLSRPGEVLDETLALLDGLLDQGAFSEGLDRNSGAEAGRSQYFAGLGARYNIAPTQPVPALLSSRRGVHLEVLRWGFVGAAGAAASSAGATKGAVKNKPSGNARSHINARAESLATKPTFRDAYRDHRCVILADGFYEWKKSSRQPFFFSPTRRRGLCFAGLWPAIDGDSDGQPDALERREGTARAITIPRRACCIVTTKANAIVEPIHDRMPVILEPEALRRWLDAEITEPSRLDPILAPLPANLLTSRPVSRQVNRVAIDDASLIEGVAEAPSDPENLTLF